MRLREGTTTVFQLSKVWPPGHDLHVLTSIQPVQIQKISYESVPTVVRGTPLQVASAQRNVKPRRNKGLHKYQHHNELQTGHQETSPIPLTNSWATLTVQEMEKLPFSRHHQFPQTHPQPSINQWN